MNSNQSGLAYVVKNVGKGESGHNQVLSSDIFFFYGGKHHLLATRKYNVSNLVCLQEKLFDFGREDGLYSMILMREALRDRELGISVPELMSFSYDYMLRGACALDGRIIIVMENGGDHDSRVSDSIFVLEFPDSTTILQKRLYSESWPRAPCLHNGAFYFSHQSGAIAKLLPDNTLDNILPEVDTERNVLRFLKENSNLHLDWFDVYFYNKKRIFAEEKPEQVKDPDNAEALEEGIVRMIEKDTMTKWPPFEGKNLKDKVLKFFNKHSFYTRIADMSSHDGKLYYLITHTISQDYREKSFSANLCRFEPGKTEPESSISNILKQGDTAVVTIGDKKYAVPIDGTAFGDDICRITTAAASQDDKLVLAVNRFIFDAMSGEMLGERPHRIYNISSNGYDSGMTGIFDAKGNQILARDLAKGWVGQICAVGPEFVERAMACLKSEKLSHK